MVSQSFTWSHCRYKQILEEPRIVLKCSLLLHKLQHQSLWETIFGYSVWTASAPKTYGFTPTECVCVRVHVLVRDVCESPAVWWKTKCWRLPHSSWTGWMSVCEKKPEWFSRSWCSFQLSSRTPFSRPSCWQKQGQDKITFIYPHRGKFKVWSNTFLIFALKRSLRFLRRELTELRNVPERLFLDFLWPLTATRAAGQMRGLGFPLGMTRCVWITTHLESLIMTTKIK